MREDFTVADIVESLIETGAGMSHLIDGARRLLTEMPSGSDKARLVRVYQARVRRGEHPVAAVASVMQFNEAMRAA